MRCIIALPPEEEKFIGNWRLEVSEVLNLEIQKSPVSNLQ